MRATSLVGVLLVLTSLALCACFYTPFYIARSSNYQKQLHILDTVCHKNNIFPEIQLNQVTHDGLSSNCSEAFVYISTWVCIGAVNDMWEGSPLYTIIHATTWRVQLALVFLLMVAICAGINGFWKQRGIETVMNATKDGKRGFSIPTGEGRRTFAFKTPQPSQKNAEGRPAGVCEKPSGPREGRPVAFKEMAESILARTDAGHESVR
jgi:hypothetical protein